ncbi:MAG: PP2C family protein-serine/threonine phosphatase [Candidatus Methylumidiphilus sp.]
MKPRNPEKTLILLVDDMPANLHVLVSALRADYRIKTATCGEEALALAKREDRPELILLDVMMPDMSGIEVLQHLRNCKETEEIPVIFVSADTSEQSQIDGLELGADDYLAKPVSTSILKVRVRNLLRRIHSEQERNEAYRKLAETQRRLEQELAEAAKYLRSLLPDPIKQGPVRVDWRFFPSTELGGDSFGYHWLDDDHFAVYLLDVSGHGVGSSLLSVSALDVLRSEALPNTDFRDPGQVLKGLNAAFSAELHDDKFFTIWYGVLRKSTRQLAYAGGGHPPALLFNGPRNASSLLRLESQGTLIGIMPGEEFETKSLNLSPTAKVILFSDGVFEIEQRSGDIWELENLIEFLCNAPPEAALMDSLLNHVQMMQGSDQLADDFSIMEIDWLGRRSEDYKV